MDIVVQALVMGIVQGLTEFLPVSSSGHLIVVPALLGWDDPFIESLAFSVMLHVATLLALLTYFRSDWRRLVAMTLVAGAAVLWVADRLGSKQREISGLTFPAAIGIGAAQALALIPGVSRSGISISAGLLAGLDREAAARFAFLMATPITAGAGLWELRKIISGEV